MLASVFSIIKIGIGPSSSHTIGPLRAAQNFLQLLESDEKYQEILSKNKDKNLCLKVELLGSLSLTGKGHLTDRALVAGLKGYDLSAKDLSSIEKIYDDCQKESSISIDSYNFKFKIPEDITFDNSFEDDRHKDLKHPNTIRFHIEDEAGNKLITKGFLSVGGGLILSEDIEFKDEKLVTLYRRDKGADKLPVITSMNGIIEYCLKKNIDLAEYALLSEKHHYNLSEDEVFSKLTEIWEVMQCTVRAGLSKDGILPGGLNVRRRAKRMHKLLLEKPTKSKSSTLASIYALAVSEENASGGRIVTTPTCGAAGILPATLTYLKEISEYRDEKLHRAILIAGLFGSVVAHNASISGAEVGCQGEVGVASSMAAAAACYLAGGTTRQIEAAAEIALEHHLGLTCDPVKGLVQIPCIERNAAGTIQALNAADMAILGEEDHKISFDKVVKTMKEIGADMHHKYKETSLGGLAALYEEI